MLIKKALLTSTFMVGISGFASQASAQAVPAENSPEVAQAEAQAAADDVTGANETIVVTGSRIQRPNLEQSSPVTVIGEDEIQLQQPVSAEEFLREIPGSVPSVGQNANNGSGGQAFVNLRGLGAGRNLVLLDGNRLTPATLGSLTDLNIIPLALIERVDTFTGGASTVYGADAVTGVINFITKRNFTGLDIAANAGISERGDGAIISGSVTFGANLEGGRGNVVMSLGYSDTNPVFLGAREQARVGLGSATGAVQGSTTSIPITFRAPIVGQLNTATGTVEAAANTYNANPPNQFQTPLTRYNIFGKADYEVSDGIEAYANGYFVKSTVLVSAAPTGIFANPLFVPLSNPFLPAGLRNQLCAAGDFNPNLAGQQALTAAECAAAATATFNSPAYRELEVTPERRFVESGNRLTTFTTNTFQFMAGLRGALTSNLDWDISGSYGESSRVQAARTASRDKTQQALRATNPNTCTVTTGGCVPINIFGELGSITPAAANFIALTAYSFVDTSLTTAQATVSGDLGFSSPLANEPIGVAVGVEYREYYGFSRGDAISAVPGAVLGAGAAALPQQGSYNSKEVFGELIIPLIEDRPFFHSLTAELGARYSDYSTSGGNWTYKAGGSWEPIPDIKFRGVYSRAVRSPNLAELFQPQVVALASLTTDPCQQQLPVNDAALRALCIATGVPASVIGTIPAPSSGQIQSTQGGNPNLNPEKATTITAGVVLQPRFVPGFALTFDYYDIKVRDAITSPTVQDIIGGCYDIALNPSRDPNVAACKQIFRNQSTGRLDGDATSTPGPVLALGNPGYLRTSGFDLGANYRRDLGFARLNVSFNGNYTTRSTFQATPTSINRECVGFYSTSCTPIQPRITWNQRTTLGFGDVDLSYVWRHISSARVEPLANVPTATNPNPVFDAFENIPAYNYFDFSVRALVTERMNFVFTVSNIFDKGPPNVGQTLGGVTFNAGNTFPSNYDPIGRRFNAGVNLRF
jgi:outer membrane receptor protein involved in Fe transport